MRKVCYSSKIAKAIRCLVFFSLSNLIELNLKNESFSLCNKLASRIEDAFVMDID